MTRQKVPEQRLRNFFCISGHLRSLPHISNLHPMSARNFFSKEQQRTIQDAIASAELNTSGEIRVHIDDTCKEEVLFQAAMKFKELKMDQTKLHNGVLFYLAVSDQLFAIIGDKGINEKVEAGFWDNIKDTMLAYFKEGQFTEGLTIGIHMAGEKLKAHFPLEANDTNELSNEVTFDDTDDTTTNPDQKDV
jgi:uncharacterized membrane protein